MQKTLTINRVTYEADYAGIGYMGYLKAQIHDERPLSEIAPEIEWADLITLEDNTGTTDFKGYTQLVRIERVDEHSVMFMLAKEDDQP